MAHARAASGRMAVNEVSRPGAALDAAGARAGRPGEALSRVCRRSRCPRRWSCGSRSGAHPGALQRARLGAARDAVVTGVDYGEAGGGAALGHRPRAALRRAGSPSWSLVGATHRSSSPPRSSWPSTRGARRWRSRSWWAPRTASSRRPSSSRAAAGAAGAAVALAGLWPFARRLLAPAGEPARLPPAAGHRGRRPSVDARRWSCALAGAGLGLARELPRVGAFLRV